MNKPFFKTVKRLVAKDLALVKRQVWLAPDAASATAVHAAITGSASAATTVTTAITNPDYARTLVVTPGGTTTDVAAGNVVIAGTDIDGNVISEDFAFTANQSTATDGTKAFKTVTSITIPTQDGAAATFAIGTLDALGLEQKLAEDSVLHTIVDGTVEATRPTVVSNSTDKTKNTLNPATALNGSKNVVAVYYYPFPS